MIFNMIITTLYNIRMHKTWQRSCTSGLLPEMFTPPLFKPPLSFKHGCNIRDRSQQRKGKRAERKDKLSCMGRSVLSWHRARELILHVHNRKPKKGSHKHTFIYRAFTSCKLAIMYFVTVKTMLRQSLGVCWVQHISIYMHTHALTAL